MTSTFIVDDETDMRLLVRIALEMSDPGHIVVAEAGDGREAVERFRDLDAPDPDVVIIDNRMPHMTGLEAAEVILRERPEQLVILYSAFLDDETRLAARRLGVSCCLAKEDVQLLADRVLDLVATRS